MDNQVYAGLLAVQRDLKAPKNQYNSFGKYNYRSAEDILSAARPLCNENGLILTCTDDIANVGNKNYVKAVAMVSDIASGGFIAATGYAREADTKKGMDDSQITGATSSYARKYALCGLFAIDDTKDSDTNESHFVAGEMPQGNKKSTNTNFNPAIDDNPQERNRLNGDMMAKVKELGLTNDAMKNIISEHFGGRARKDLSNIELKTLVNNLEDWAMFK